jgi:hypothetical protein
MDGTRGVGEQEGTLWLLLAGCCELCSTCQLPVHHRMCSDAYD